MSTELLCCGAQIPHQAAVTLKRVPRTNALLPGAPAWTPPNLNYSVPLLTACYIQEDLNHTHIFNPAMPITSLHFQPLLGPKPLNYFTIPVSIFIFQNHLTKGKQTQLSFHQNLKVFILYFLSQGQLHHVHHHQARNVSCSYPNLISLTLLIKVLPKVYSFSLTASCISPPIPDSHCPHYHPCPHLPLPGFLQLPPDWSIPRTACLWHL